MEKLITYITEQSGAVWAVYSTNASGDRAFWVSKLGGVPSEAKPMVIGFYAKSVNEAANALNN
jgi:hypothetical protein